MPDIPISQSPFQKHLKATVSGLILCVCLVGILYVVFSLIWYFARQNAEQFAVNLAESIHPPADVVQIQNWRGSSGASLECYVGYSSTLYGSNLPLTEVVKYYRSDFTQRGWHVMPREIDSVFGENGKKLGIDEADITIMGIGRVEIDYTIDVAMCRSNYCDNFPYPQAEQALIAAARKQFESVYWLIIAYKPENVRKNMCGCCQGG